MLYLLIVIKRDALKILSFKVNKKQMPMHAKLDRLDARPPFLSLAMADRSLVFSHYEVEIIDSENNFQLTE